MARLGVLEGATHWRVLVLSRLDPRALSIHRFNLLKGGGQSKGLAIELVRLCRITQIIHAHMGLNKVAAFLLALLRAEEADY